MLPKPCYLFFRVLALMLAAHLVFPPHLWATFRDLSADNFILEWNDETQFHNRDWQQISQEFSEQLQEAFIQSGKAQTPMEQDRRWHRLEEDLRGGHEELKRVPLDSFSVALIEARRAYFALQLPLCLDHLHKAQDFLQQKAPGSYFDSAWAFQYFLMVGVCKLASGDSPGANAAFQKALGLRPKEYLSEMTFSPQVIEAYEAARTFFLAQNKFSDQGSLSISSSPPFADVFLNGEYVGQTPMTLTDLYPGDHFVQLKQHRYVEWYSRIHVQPRTPLRLNAAMKPLAWASSSESSSATLAKLAGPFQFISSAKGDPEVLAELKQLATLLQVPQITLMTLSPKGLDYGLRLRVYDEKRNAFLDEVAVDLMPVKAGMTEALQQVLQGLNFPQGPSLAARNPRVAGREGLREAEETQILSGNEAALQPPLNPGQSPPAARLNFEEVETPASPIAQGPSTQDMDLLQAQEAGPRPVYKRWWFWTLVAVAAAGAGAGAAYALGQGGSAPGGGGFSPGGGIAANGVIVGSQRR